MRPRVLLEHGDLLERMNDELQVVAGRNFELAGGEHAFEHDDGMRDARGSQCEPLLDTRDAERVRAGKRARGVNETVAICVGFDRCDDARSRCEAADYRKVVAQGRSIDGDDRHAAHESP